MKSLGKLFVTLVLVFIIAKILKKLITVESFSDVNTPTKEYIPFAYGDIENIPDTKLIVLQKWKRVNDAAEIKRFEQLYGESIRKTLEALMVKRGRHIQKVLPQLFDIYTLQSADSNELEILFKCNVVCGQNCDTDNIGLKQLQILYSLQIGGSGRVVAIKEIKNDISFTSFDTRFDDKFQIRNRLHLIKGDWRILPSS